MENSGSSEEVKVDLIMRQTAYSREQALEYLKEFDGDYINVIKQFMGIKPKPTTIKSLNQEIYKQIRTKLDTSMKEYNAKNPISIEDVADKLGR